MTLRGVLHDRVTPCHGLSLLSTWWGFELPRRQTSCHDCKHHEKEANLRREASPGLFLLTSMCCSFKLNKTKNNCFSLLPDWRQCDKLPQVPATMTFHPWLTEPPLCEIKNRFSFEWLCCFVTLTWRAIITLSFLLNNNALDTTLPNLNFQDFCLKRRKICELMHISKPERLFWFFFVLNVLFYAVCRCIWLHVRKGFFLL